MKKLITVSILLTALLIPLAAAVNGIEVDVNGYASGTTLMLSVGTEGTAGQLSLSPGADIYFDRMNGLDVRADLCLGQRWTSFGLDLGYAVKLPLRYGFTVALKSGFFWQGNFMHHESFHVIGFFLSCDVSYRIWDELYLMLGLRDDIDIAQFYHGRGMESSTYTMFQNTLTIPRVGLGYTF